MMERLKSILRFSRKGFNTQNNAPAVPESPGSEHYSWYNQSAQIAPGESSEPWRHDEYYDPPRVNQYVFKGSPLPTDHGTGQTFVVQPMPPINENAGSDASHTVPQANG